VLDYVALMNYDIWGPWSASVGPNAPLDDSCAEPANQAASAVGAVKKWNAAGIPLDQLVLGVPGYGHSFRVRKNQAFINGSTTSLRAYPAFDNVDRPTGDAWDDASGPDVCGVVNPPGGNFNFWGLIANGFLKEDGSPAPGIGYRYDTCSQTVCFILPKARAPD
jgi:chitinase